MNQTDLNQKIMVVDDNHHYLRLIERMLHISNYHNVLSVTDPMMVVDAYKKSRPALLLIDIDMSDNIGFDILEDLRREKTFGALPVIVLAAQKEHKDKAMRMGAQDVISKPFMLKDVISCIKSFFDRYQQISQVEMRGNKSIAV